MTNIVTIPAKTLASKRRVSAAMAANVLYMDRAQQEQDREAEVDRFVSAALVDLDMSIRRIYAARGAVRAKTLIDLAHSKVFEDTKVTE